MQGFEIHVRREPDRSELTPRGRARYEACPDKDGGAADMIVLFLCGPCAGVNERGDGYPAGSFTRIEDQPGEVLHDTWRGQTCGE